MKPDEIVEALDTQSYRVQPSTKIDLAAIPTEIQLDGASKSDGRKALEAIKEESSDLQNQMYAENRQSLLIVFQAMDAGGKDGTIRKVMTGFNPQGCKVHSFKKPTERELEHDFLWRIHQVCPPKGEIAVFNRSHYEDVLVVRVHNLVSKKIWTDRYDIINEFEKLLVKQGTQILKFYLHISPDEQLSRFEKRLDNPEKNWKISESDYSERKHWDSYQDAFSDVFEQCSTTYAPWYIVPANTKWHRDLIVAKVIHEKLSSMNFQTPKANVDLDEIRKMYHQAVQK